MTKKRMIIGLVGMPGSGKTTIARILAQKGFKIITLSDFIKEELEKKGMNLSRKNLQDIGDKLRNSKGADILAKLASDLVNRQKHKKVVIDGIRNLSEIEKLENADNFYLIGVSATPDKRFKRLIRFDRYNSIKTWADFIYYELRENAGIDKKSGQQNLLCYLNAKYFIDNSDTIKSLNNKVRKVLQKINNEN